jgi:hypothetical protein
MSRRIKIEESNMVFDFAEDDVFWIEKCPTVKAIGDGVKIVEMIVKQNDVLMFIEAKQSSPRPDNKEPFDDFMKEMYEKFRNSLILFAGIALHRRFRENSQLPTNFTPSVIETLPIRFYLIIKGHKEEWLPPLDEALQLSLGVIQKCFGIASVKVINDSTAKNHNLIL